MQMIEFLYQNNISVHQTSRAVHPFNSVYDRPSERLTRITMDCFLTTFTLNDNMNPIRHGTVRSVVTAAAVQVSIEEGPNQSNGRRSQHRGCVLPLYGGFYKRFLV